MSVLYWHCLQCGAHEPVQPTGDEHGYKLGDHEPCIDCGDGTAHVVTLTLRPEVAAFAQAMEAKLRENDHKGRVGWKGEDTNWLLRRLREETDELASVVARQAIGAAQYTGEAAQNERRDWYRPEVTREAADVANFAMMIADVCGALPVAAPAPTTGPLIRESGCPAKAGLAGESLDRHGQSSTETEGVAVPSSSAAPAPDDARGETKGGES